MLPGEAEKDVRMGRGPGSSLHQRVTAALIRSAQVQEESRALIATTRAIHARMEVTRACSARVSSGRAAVQRARERRTRGGTFAVGQVDDQDRFGSG
jgi:hypothetical protein